MRSFALYFNARGLTNKLVELEMEINANPDVLVFMITETWLSEAVPNSLFTFCQDFYIIRCDRNVKQHGGVLLLVHRSVSIMPVFDRCFDGFIEALCIKLTYKRKSFLVAVVYRSPLSTALTDVAFVEHMENASMNLDVLMCGDFNLPGLYSNNREHHSATDDLFQGMFDELGLVQMVTKPTRGENILDLVFTSSDFLVDGIQVLEPFSTSDHCKVLFEFRAFECTEALPQKFRDFKNADYEQMESFLGTIDWSSLFEHVVSVNELWEIFTNIIDYAIFLYVPLRTRANKKNCWSSITRNAYRQKSKLWQKYKKNKSAHNLNEYRNKAQEAKDSSERDILITENKILKAADMKKFYAFVNGKWSTGKRIPSLKKDGILYDSPKHKADLFQEQFLSVFTVDNNVLPDFPMQTLQSLNTVTISETIVLKAIQKLPNKASSGPDGIPSMLIKTLKLVLVEPLTKIFNVSFETGCLPKQWLDAKIVPIFKKGDPAVVSNYRPISLTAVVSKVLEGIVRNRMMDFLVENNLVSPKQHGFVSRRSTVTNVLRSLNSWFNSVNDRKIIHAAYLDFAKAFDSVPHPKLLLKLSRYGFSGKLFSWLQAFLSNRTQHVVVDGKFSESEAVKSGVPQGTVLGPILFMIYINDLASVVNSCELAMFADDAKIYDIVTPDIVTSPLLQADLSVIHRWSKTWQLQVAVHKCSVFVFGKSVVVPSYQLGDMILSVTSEINDLGFLLSSDGKFTAHCNKIASKALRVSSNIFRIFKTRDSKFLMKMFDTYVRPIVEYGTQVWNPFLQKDIDRIENVLRAYTKRIPSVQQLAYTDRLKALNITSLEYRRLILDLNVGFKIVRRQTGLEFDDFFQYDYITGVRANSLKLKAVSARIAIVQAFFTGRFVKIWNSLPDSVVKASTVATFNSKLRHIDLNRFCRGRVVS